MYNEILEGIPYLKVYNLVKKAGVTRYEYDALETKGDPDKLKHYRNILKQLKVFASELAEIIQGDKTVSDAKEYLKVGYFKGMSQEDINESLGLSLQHVRNAFSDLLTRYKKLKEEDEIEELEPAVPSISFVQEGIIEEEPHKENGAKLISQTRKATPEQVASFLRTEGEYVRKK